MPKVTVYSTMLCPYCFMAKKLLNKKGVEFEEIDVGRRPELRQEMMTRAGGRHTVPQIFIGGESIGGGVAVVGRGGGRPAHDVAHLRRVHPQGPRISGDDVGGSQRRRLTGEDGVEQPAEQVDVGV